MGRRAGLCLLAILFSIHAHAINAIVSHALFHIAETGSNKIGDAYIEIYWQVIPGDMHFSKQDDKWRANIKADIVFRNDTGIFAEQHISLRTPPANSLAEAQVQNITDLHRYKMPAGKIKVTLKLSEPGYPREFNYTDSFRVEKRSGIFYSGIQILDTAYASAQTNVFSKNGKQHVPLCINFLDNYRSVLHYYTELYQANALPEDAYPLIQRTFISKKEYEGTVYGLARTDSIHKHLVLPIYGDFAMAALASGNYYLNVVVEDRMGQRIAANSYFFQRENKNPVQALNKVERDSAMEKVVVLDISKTFVMKYTLPQLMAILKMITPISSQGEAQAIKGFQKKPDDMYMRYFIYNFWVARNKENPSDEWKRYSERLKEVNKLFNTGTAMGYETDRGIAYLKYGPPDERVPVLNEPGALPYEIWEYKVLGKQNQEGVFLFYRPPQLINDFMLLHTTINGEVRNQNWRSYLFPTNGSAVSTSNSRAEQYIRNR